MPNPTPALIHSLIQSHSHSRLLSLLPTLSLPDIRAVSPHTLRGSVHAAFAACDIPVFLLILEYARESQELSLDIEGGTVLHSLCEGGDAASARVYVQCVGRAVVRRRNSEGREPIAVACQEGRADVVALLCDLGADVNCADSANNSPLHIAAAWGHSNVVALLIERGADPTRRNNETFTAADVAFSWAVAHEVTAFAKQFSENQRRMVRARAGSSAAASDASPAAARGRMLSPPPASISSLQQQQQQQQQQRSNTPQYEAAYPVRAARSYSSSTVNSTDSTPQPNRVAMYARPGGVGTSGRSASFNAASSNGPGPGFLLENLPPLPVTPIKSGFFASPSRDRFASPHHPHPQTRPARTGSPSPPRQSGEDNTIPPVPSRRLAS